jgi:hypothetical protein
MIVAHLIQLPTALIANSFEEFVRTRYLKAIHEGTTPLGQVMSVKVLRRRRLQQGEPLDLGRSFLLLVDFEGVEARLPRIDDEAVEKLFEAFNATITELGAFDEVASREMGGT